MHGGRFKTNYRIRVIENYLIGGINRNVVYRVMGLQQGYDIGVIEILADTEGVHIVLNVA